MKVALAHKGWWVRIHIAVRGIYDDAIESFPDFVRRVYTSDRPSELGKMAIAFAFTSDADGSSIYTLVDRLVVSDMSYMSTTEGLECLILLAILYADEGQPRRSWMIYRRGVLVAQLTDLYQAGLRSTAKRRLWLSIYQADRMMSMFLGLPYGFVDMHHQQILEVKPENDYVDSTMTIRCAMIAGKVIDRNHSRTKASISKTLELDEEMNELATSFPETWWELPTRVQADGHDFDEIHVRLHQQLFFFHLRLYIYLPFLSGSEENSVHGSIVRAASMEAARQLLRRYLSLHSDAEKPSPSECKLVDFMAFTGAIILLLGCSSSSGPRISSDGTDIEAVLSLIRCLQRQENQEDCPIASQCRKTLAVLLSRSSTDEEVRIPFFGTVVKKGDPTVEQIAQGNQSFITNANAGDIHDLPASQLFSSTNGTNSTPATEDLALPSSAYLEAPWGMQHMPELDFLSYLEEVSADFDTGWEFIMDLDSF
uniref:Transcription factor domain-containing protein n=1 Tax=Bionectria ochroleuca TaxID=29856 RepID=A0A8H7TQ66_BIOOC